ncbi:MAG: DMT family transporter [Candidatus Hodarchaeales archaeon]|jgi:drug/metabolite transporter (DMT)-like permease
MVQRKPLAYLAIVIASFCWGTSYTVVKIGLTYLDPPIPPMGYLALRFTLALVVLSPFLIFGKYRNDLLVLIKNKYIVILGLVNGSSFILQFLGQAGTTAAIATLMVNTFLISTPLFSTYMTGEKVSSRIVIGIILGFIGAAITSISVLTTDVPEEEIWIFIISTIFVLLSGLIWGVYGVISQILNKRGLEEGIHEMNNATATFGASNLYSVILVSITMIFLNQVPTTLTAGSWAAIAYLAVIGTILPFILYIFASQMIPPTELNVITMLNVIVGLFLAILVLSEKLTVFGLFGSGLIIIAIYLASTNERNPPISG